MGYHDQREIPNYWTYAKNFVLQDHMFEPSLSWSLVSHLYMVSALVGAVLAQPPTPSTCVPNNTFPDGDGLPRSNNPLVQQLTGAAAGILQPADADDLQGSPQPPDYAWTDITYLLHKYNVSWRYYVEQGTEPDCADRRDDMRPGAAGGDHAGDLEPAAGLRHRPPGQPARQHPELEQHLHRRAVREPAGGGLGRSQRRRLRASAGEHPRRPGARDQHHQRDHDRARTGSRPRSSSPGTTGAASTTTSRRRRSTSRDTDSACRGS